MCASMTTVSHCRVALQVSLMWFERIAFIFSIILLEMYLETDPFSGSYIRR